MTSFADNTGSEKPEYSKVSINEIRTNLLFLPYADSNHVEMTKLSERDEYSLWKCPAHFVCKKPSFATTGKSYNYFVFKNGEFHLTVTDFNKSDVYKFFTKKI